MNYARNYEKLLNFVKVVPKILVVPFFLYMVYFLVQRSSKILLHIHVFTRSIFVGYFNSFLSKCAKIIVVSLRSILVLCLSMKILSILLLGVDFFTYFVQSSGCY